jgi:DNA-binding NarL/FixJ family response regulator
MKLIVISEHPCCRLGLATTLKEVGPAAVIVEAASIDHMVEQIGEDGKVDLVLLDTSSKFGREMEAVTRLQEIGGIGAVIVVHEQDHPEIVRRYLDMGVQGVLPKTAELPVVVSAVRLVLSGARYVPESILNPEVSGFEETTGSFEGAGLERLTRRQMDVLKELGRGASNQEIGTQLGIALATVKLHVNAILNTLGVRNRTEAAIIAYRAGLTALSKS